MMPLRASSSEALALTYWGYTKYLRRCAGCPQSAIRHKGRVGVRRNSAIFPPFSPRLRCGSYQPGSKSRLVVSTPLKNMTSWVGMMKFPYIMENKIHVPNHQPEIHILYIYISIAAFSAFLHWSFIGTSYIPTFCPHSITKKNLGY